jgi:hypothetical protein
LLVTNLVEAGDCSKAKLAASINPPDIVSALLLILEEEVEKPEVRLAKRETTAGATNVLDHMVSANFVAWIGVVVSPPKEKDGVVGSTRWLWCIGGRFMLFWHGNPFGQ